MKYSPLTIHCTSLCFDVIQQASFETLNHDDIDGFHDDIYLLVRERTSLQPRRHQREHQFLCYVTQGVLNVLHQCLNNPKARDSTWILSVLESRISLSVNTTLH
ncbi:hypothetical protein CXR47_21170 [Vibrio parahaemolyticus]|nr:hypothetical protein CXR47_21170 [Vibrio parahaemolyticus]